MIINVIGNFARKKYIFWPLVKNIGKCWELTGHAVGPIFRHSMQPAASSHSFYVIFLSLSFEYSPWAYILFTFYHFSHKIDCAIFDLERNRKKKKNYILMSPIFCYLWSMSGRWTLPQTIIREKFQKTIIAHILDITRCAIKFQQNWNDLANIFCAVFLYYYFCYLLPALCTWIILIRQRVCTKIVKYFSMCDEDINLVIANQYVPLAYG